MSNEQATVVAAVFALLASVVAGAAVVSRRRLALTGGQRPSWLVRCLAYLGSHLQLALAALVVSTWLVPLGLYIVKVVREDKPVPVLGTCEDISVPADYEGCKRNIWLATNGTCEVPASVFALSTGTHDSDMRLYCIQLAIKYDRTGAREGKSLTNSSSLLK